MGLTLLFNSPTSAGVPFTAGPATNLFFLFNEAGRYATSVDNITGGTAPGYSNLDLISGPRSTMWRSANFSSAQIGYSYPGVGISYVVIARADLLLSSAGKVIIGQQKSSGGTWSSIPGFLYNPLTASSLVGPKSQDIVVPTVPTDLRGISIYTAPPSGLEASMFSKLYAGGAFAFSTAPQLGVEWSEFPPETYQTPLKGTLPYEVERTFSLTFNGVQQSEYTQFQLYDSFYSPFFLYDSTGDIWPWKLEHVILTGFTAVMNEVNNYTLTMEFYRLRHYDS